MLSTSILYCNKLDDDRQLQQLETMVVEGAGGGGGNGSAAAAGRSSNNSSSSALGHSNVQRPPSTSPKVSAHRHHRHRHNQAPSTASSNPSVLHPSDVFSDVAASSAITTTSTPTSTTVANKSRFRVRYLGCNSCDPRRHPLDGGIASYQKPLLDLYATVLRRSVFLRSLYSYSIAAVNQVADISSHGIVVAERDRFASSSPSVRSKLEANSIIANEHQHHRHQQQPRRPNSSVSETVHSTSQDVSFTSHSASTTMAATVETVVTKVITPLSNILLFAAVRFQHRSRNAAKRTPGRRGGRRQVVGVAFVPLSCSEAVLDKNAFVSLPAKQRFLLGLPHPPLFACVLQKVNAVHRLECHLFVCLTADDAIRMCASVAEHRRRGGAIGRLQVPLPGTMGTYSYAPSALSTTGSRLATATPTVHSSSAPSIVSNRSSKHSGGGYSISELSSSAATFIRNSSSQAFSDIEEEEDQSSNGGGDGAGGRRRLPANRHQLRPLFSTTTEPQQSTSALRMAALFQGRAFSNGNNHFPHHPPTSSERDLLVQRILDQQKAPKKSTRNDNGLSNGVGDSLSWTELSSISSAFISTKSEPPPPGHRNGHSQLAVAAAQRDYRLQSYKNPENFVLPELHSTAAAKSEAELKSNCDSTATTVASIVTSAAGSKRKPKHNSHGQALPETTVKVLERASELNYGTNSNKWLSMVGDELQSNRLFAKASAIASLEQARQEQGARAPSSDHRTSTNAANGFHEEHPSAAFTRSPSTPRFFGDTIRDRPKTAPKPEVKAAHLKNLYPSSPSANLRNSTAAVLSSREFIESGRLREQIKLANGFKENGNIRAQQEHPSSNLQSTISNSIFFDEEISSSSSKSGRGKGGVKQKAKSQPNLLSGDLQKRQRQPDKNSAAPKLPAVEPVPSVVLYLPTETSNVGVKCFNKSTPVDRWSTMMPATAASTGSLREAQLVDGCELCSFELEAAAAADNCEECCKLCQSLEHHHPQMHQQKGNQRRPQSISACPECMADEDHGGGDDDDEIILDEAILQNFSNAGNSHTLPHHSHQQLQQQQQQPKQQTASEDGSRRRRRREARQSAVGGQNGGHHVYRPPMIEDVRLENNNAKSIPYRVATHQKTTFFGRIRQLGSSIFGSKPHPSPHAVAPSSTNRSRSLLWGRNSLKKLKERRNRALLAKEQQQHQQLHQVNRIFLPPASNEYSGARVYSEHYLKPPSPPQKTTSSKAKESDGEANGESNGGSSGRRPRPLPKDAKNAKPAADKSTPPKPFFISHPSEFNPAQVLSISSDSGMEEYDCHSSSEHSPLAAVNGQQKKTAQELENRSSKAPLAKMTGAKLTRSSPVKPQSQQQSRPVATANKTPSTSANKISGHWSETNLQNELGYMP